MRWQQRQPVLLPCRQAAQFARGNAEKLDADQCREFEHHPDSDRRFAAFYVPYRDDRNTRTVRQLRLRPPPFAPPLSDPQPEHPCRVERLERVGTITRHVASRKAKYTFLIR